MGFVVMQAEIRVSYWAGARMTTETWGPEHAGSEPVEAVTLDDTIPHGAAGCSCSADGCIHSIGADVKNRRGGGGDQCAARGETDAVLPVVK